VGIEFHCKHCNKLIRAPREHGGKRGRCPYCKQSVYVPRPPDEVEEIPVAPLDQGEEQRRKQLDAESLRVERALLHEQREPPETGRPGASGGAGETAMPLPRVSGSADVAATVILFVKAMRASDLDQAERLAGSLRSQSAAVREHVQRLTVDDIPPPELAGISPALLKGFLRTLLDRM